MTFWLLTTEYPPLSGGGISTYCYHTARMLHENGHEVTVFISNYTIRQIKECHSEGIKTIHFSPDNSTHEYLGEETSMSMAFARVMENYVKIHRPPDYIEAQEYNGIAYFALQKKLLLSDYFSKTIFYITAHAPAFLYYDYNQAPDDQIPLYWIGEMEKSVLTCADAVIFPSAYLEEKLEEFIPWDLKNNCVIHNPFQLSAATNSLYTEHDIVFFGKLTASKGCLELLEYFKILWDDGFEHPLHIIGSGKHFFYPKLMDMEEFIRNKYKKYLDAGLLIFEGHIMPDSLEKRLASAHIIIVPSLVDNLPYTVIEAMAMGKIVLASDSGGQKEIIEDGKSGFIFKHDSQGKSFRKCLMHILSLNPEIIQSIGLSARNRIVACCAYDKIYPKKMQFLKSLVPKTHTSFPFVHEVISPDTISTKYLEEKLTVVIPFFNMGKFIQDCVLSIKNSIYTPIEIIIVNDGSDDPNSIEALTRLQHTDSLQVYHQENKGLAETRNKGATLAKGKYLAFLDADDTVEPSYYEKAIFLLKKYSNVSFVGCWANYFDQSHISWPSFNPEPPYLLVHNMINSSALVYNTNDFLKAGLNDPAFIYGMEDYDSVINMVKNGFRGVAIPEKLWNYRVRKGSMARTFNDFSKIYLYKLLTKKHASLYRQFAPEVINLLNANGQGFKLENPTRITRSTFPFLPPKLISVIKSNKVLRNIARKLYTYLTK